MEVRRQAKVLSVSFLTLGLALCVVTAVLWLRTRTFIRESVSASGRVVELEYGEGLGGRSGGGHITVFTFVDAAGQSHTNRAGAAQSPPTHQVGDTVTVLYAPNDPAVARIQGFRTLWVVHTFLGGFGFAFTGIGLVAWFAVRKTYE